MSGALPFAERLDMARELLRWRSQDLAGLPLHELDQLQAAAESTRGLLDLAALEVRAAQPRRGWYGPVTRPPALERDVMIVAAVLGATKLCPHLQRSGPQPVFVNLAAERMSCQRCSQTRYRPSPADADKCDVCHARGIERFVPFVLQSSAALVFGDCCPTCADQLGLSEVAA